MPPHVSSRYHDLQFAMQSIDGREISHEVFNYTASHAVGCKRVCTHDKCEGTRTNPIPHRMQWVVKEKNTTTGCCALQKVRRRDEEMRDERRKHALEYMAE